MGQGGRGEEAGGERRARRYAEQRLEDEVAAALGHGAMDGGASALVGSRKELELGHAEIERRLARQMAAARSSRLMSALSRGGRRLCTLAPRLRVLQLDRSGERRRVIRVG